MAFSRHDCTWRYKGVPGDELPRAVAQLLRIPRDRLQVPLSLSPSCFARSRCYPSHPFSAHPTLLRTHTMNPSRTCILPTRTRLSYVCIPRIRPKVLEHTRVIRLLFPVASCGIVRVAPGTYFRRRANFTSRRTAMPANTENMTRSHYKLALSTLPLSTPYVIRLHHRTINPL